MSVGLAMRDDWSGRASISFNPMVSATNYSVRRVALARVHKAMECCEAWRRKQRVEKGTICKKETIKNDAP